MGIIAPSEGTGTSLVGTGSVEVCVVTPPYVGPNFSSASLDLTLAATVTSANVQLVQIGSSRFCTTDVTGSEQGS